MGAEHLTGRRPGNDPRASRVERPGRLCGNDGCGTRLSIYNRSGYCWLHQPLVFPNYRGRAIKPSQP